MSAEIVFHFPAQADLSEMLDFGLVTLTEAIAQIAPETLGAGCLGGEFGYGANYETEAFAMRTFYWGDCDCGYEQREAEWSEANKHRDDCYYVEARRRIEASPLQSERDMALKRRNKMLFGSASEDGAQREVERICDAITAFEDEVYRELCERHAIPWNDGYGRAVHCTCGHDAKWLAWSRLHTHTAACSLELPNFRHKASGLEVRWYKWIGRDMETKNDSGVDLRAVFAECFSSLPKK